MLLEAGRYLAGLPASRLRQLGVLRDLDDRLLTDIGGKRRPAGAWITAVGVAFGQGDQKGRCVRWTDSRPRR